MIIDLTRELSNRKFIDLPKAYSPKLDANSIQNDTLFVIEPINLIALLVH